MGHLEGKVAVVTGSGGGIGRAEALLFAREGAKVVVNDLGGARDGAGQSKNMADEVVREIAAQGGTAVANYDSVATTAGAESIVKTAVEAFGRLDVFVNNAGILRDKTLLKMDEAMWDSVISVHLRGTFLCTQAAAKQMIAWAPDEPMLYDKLTPMEYLEFVAGLWGVAPKEGRARAESLLKFLGLWDQRDQRCEAFSRGMKQKAALAGALVHEPKMLILDEPLTGLDAAVSRQVKDLLQEKVRGGATVILTTHILEVAERIADRIGIIQSGKLLAEGTLAELREKAGERDGTLEDVFLELTGELTPESAPAAEAAPA